MGKGASVVLEFGEDLRKTVDCVPKTFFAELINIYKIHVKVYAHETMIRNY